MTAYCFMAALPLSLSLLFRFDWDGLGRLGYFPEGFGFGRDKLQFCLGRFQRFQNFAIAAEWAGRLLGP